jgi:hypothetical protein
VRLSSRELQELAGAETVERAGNGNVGFAFEVQGQGVERCRVLASNAKAVTVPAGFRTSVRLTTVPGW